MKPTANPLEGKEETKRLISTREVCAAARASKTCMYVSRQKRKEENEASIQSFYPPVSKQTESQLPQHYPLESSIERR